MKRRGKAKQPADVVWLPEDVADMDELAAACAAAMEELKAAIVTME
jgi:hypothetical protein